MGFVDVYNKIQQILYVMYTGLWVLFVYIRWIFGLDIFFSLSLHRLEKRKIDLQMQLSCLTGKLTKDEKKVLSSAVELIVKDISQLEQKKKEVFVKTCKEVLQQRFSKGLYLTL